ncbi:ankyrin repeat-containing domain protein [Favolaschia claudopus]|uniref:Ankyrin repeat-containing domain protein n=1 Tax=Favolaschia claudopus TaxID=2862362 RepID=A0AAW0AF82_9AGAR
MDMDQSTPLHYAASEGNTEIVKSLISHGALFDVVDNEDMLAMHHAAEYGHYPVIQILIDFGNDIDCKSHLGLTALHYAAKHDQRETVVFLVEQGADICQGNPPLPRPAPLFLASLQPSWERYSLQTSPSSHLPPSDPPFPAQRNLVPYWSSGQTSSPPRALVPRALVVRTSGLLAPVPRTPARLPTLPRTWAKPQLFRRPSLDAPLSRPGSSVLPGSPGLYSSGPPTLRAPSSGPPDSGSGFPRSRTTGYLRAFVGLRSLDQYCDPPPSGHIPGSLLLLDHLIIDITS